MDEYEKYLIPARHSCKSLTSSMAGLVESIEGVVNWLIDFNKLIKKLKGRRKALERSHRNQQNPMKPKKCKHGRQYRTKRRN